LQGLFIFGPDVRSLFFTIFPFLAPMVVFYIFVPKHFINEFPDHWGVLVMVIAIVFTIYVSVVLLSKLFRGILWRLVFTIY
jgi:palmitoyltransferase ZDHHC9/14/18